MGMDSRSEADGVRDSYAPRSFVDEGALETIHQANTTFLALVARRASTRGGAPHASAKAAANGAPNGTANGTVCGAAGATPAATPFGVAAEFARRVAALDPRARRVAAECPYTLFNLRFEDDAFWREVAHDALAQLADEKAADSNDALGTSGSSGTSVTRGTAGKSDAPGPPARPVLDVAAGDAHVAVFALKAAFLAWHLARNTDGVAAVALGMTQGVMEAWRSVPLSALDRCAGAVLPHLQARWGTNARFWGPLLEAAEHQGRTREGPDARRADAAPERLAESPERVHLLGLQLLAADGCRGYLPKRARR